MNNSNNNKSEQFLQIQFDILAIKKINNITFSDSEKLLYCYLRSWQQTTGKVFPSYAKLMDVFGVGSTDTITKRLDKLEALGLLKVTRTKGEVNKYQVIEIDKATTTNQQTGQGGLS